MNKVNYLALGAVALTIMAVFLPWLEVSDANVNADLADSFQPVIIHGISIGYGIIGFLVALLGGYLTYKEYKWTFVAGIVNFINGYGYLHQWFGAGSHDSGNYGDVTSRSSVDPKLGIYLFMLASFAFIVFTVKYYLSKRTVKVLSPVPEKTEVLHPTFTPKNTQPSHVYQPSNIQKMTTNSTESPKEPTSNETPKVPETAKEQPAVTPILPEPKEPKEPKEPVVSAKPVETPKQPEPVIVPEPVRAVYAPKVTETPQPPYVEPVKKKSSTTVILLIILAIVLAGAGVFVFTNTSTSTQKSNEKNEQSINEEKARLEVIINEVNTAVNDKKYDDALLKINSVNWLYDPTANKGYVDQYNSQRENLRNTIEQLKTSQIMDDQKRDAEKANQTAQPVQSGDSIK